MAGEGLTRAEVATTELPEGTWVAVLRGAILVAILASCFLGAIFNEVLSRTVPTLMVSDRGGLSK